MQLSFLGQPYQASLPFVEVLETTDTGTFLGKRYIKKQFNIGQRQRPSEELMYRGIRYSR